MRILPLTVLIFASAILAATAQLSVEIVADQDQFLRDESVSLKVRVTNRSGQTLRLGTDNEWLSFSMEAQEGGAVTKLGEVPVRGEFTLESAHVVTRQVDLAPSFDLSEPGRYLVTATVRIKEWNNEVSSKSRRVEIVRGTKIWEQEFGVPGATGQPEMRRYILQQANYQKQLKLFLRLADLSDQKVFRIYPLGSMVSFSQPEAQLNGQNQLYVLFQTGARSFSFYLIQPDGDVLLRQTYDYTATRPTLRSNDEGRIYIAGGVRRITLNDIPPPQPMTNAPVASVAATNTNTTASAGSATNAASKPDGKRRKK